LAVEIESIVVRSLENNNDRAEQYFNWFSFFGGEFWFCNKNNTAKNIKKRLFHFEISHQKFVKKGSKPLFSASKRNFLFYKIQK
jgi:hypothetical protein